MAFEMLHFFISTPVPFLIYLPEFRAYNIRNVSGFRLIRRYFILLTELTLETLANGTMTRNELKRYYLSANLKWFERKHAAIGSKNRNVHQQPSRCQGSFRAVTFSEARLSRNDGSTPSEVGYHWKR